MNVRKVLVGIGLAALVCATTVVIIADQETVRRAELLAEQSTLVETRHGDLEYVVWGTGRPALVLHGAGGGFDQGRLLAESLGGTGRRWIAISRFGYLRSDLPSNASVTAQAEAIADLLDQLDIEQVDILAMSGGVPPAIKFAELFSERADRMVLLSSAPFTPFRANEVSRPIPTWAYTRLLGSDVIYYLLRKLARDRLATAFDARPDLLGHADPEKRAFVDALIDGFVPGAQRLDGLNNEGSAIDPRLSYDLSSIRSPTLIVHARDDSLNPFEIGAELADDIPRAQFIALKSGGHLLLGHHRELRSRIRAFLEAGGA